MPQEVEPVDPATLEMEDGWPPVAKKFWDKVGALKRGLSVGNVRNVAKRGATIMLPNDQETIFPAPVQTQIIVKLEDGVLLTEGYDLKIHRETVDIPLMETTPAELESQLYGESGDRLEPEGRQLSNVRKNGIGRIKWHADYHPPVRRR